MQLYICQKSLRKSDSFIVCISPSICSKPFRRKIFFCSKNVQTVSGTHPNLRIGDRGYLREVNRPAREVNHSSPPIAEIKNEWCYISSLLACLHDVDRDNFTHFTIYIYIYIQGVSRLQEVIS